MFLPPLSARAGGDSLPGEGRSVLHADVVAALLSERRPAPRPAGGRGAGSERESVR